ncbi:MAG TPA: OB-fold domain-containing protein [Acidimicrobiia bacterium]|nr:OB-fold domain-containing protein [Acidimicrobiia bacterium]
MSPTKPAVPAVAGWFTTGEDGGAPTLLGSRCTACGVVAFPPRTGTCPNPACRCTGTEVHPLARTGRVWSYTDARYQPPPPYVSPSDPYEPFVLAAVELDADGLVVLGQMTAGCTAGTTTVGQPVELVVEPLLETAETLQLVWKWRPCGS